MATPSDPLEQLVANWSAQKNQCANLERELASFAETQAKHATLVAQMAATRADIAKAAAVPEPAVTVVALSH